MLDFAAYRAHTVSLDDLIAGLDRPQLRELTNEMIDTVLGLIADCVDGDVVFLPQDPDADDPYASTPDEAEIAWTLGHVIVHITASAEESAALAAELARGVPHHGRSRYEIPWRTVTTMDQCRNRLQESRRMRLASLDSWPDSPHVENTYQSRPDAPALNCVARFVLGLRHDFDHLGQIEEIVRQAVTARA